MEPIAAMATKTFEKPEKCISKNGKEEEMREECCMSEKNTTQENSMIIENVPTKVTLFDV